MNRLMYRITYTMIVVILLSFFCNISLVFADEFSYDSHGKRDPFVSPTGGDGKNSQLGSGDLRLEGIVVDLKGQSYAIVNGEIVKEGQSLQGFKLKKITAKEVQFEQDGQTFNVPLRQDDDLSAVNSKK